MNLVQWIKIIPSLPENRNEEKDFRLIGGEFRTDYLLHVCLFSEVLQLFNIFLMQSCRSLVREWLEIILVIVVFRVILVLRVLIVFIILSVLIIIPLCRVPDLWQGRVKPYLVLQGLSLRGTVESSFHICHPLDICRTQLDDFIVRIVFTNIAKIVFTTIAMILMVIIRVESKVMGILEENEQLKEIRFVDKFMR